MQVARVKGDLFCRIILRCLPASISRFAGPKFVNRTLMQFRAQNCFLARHGLALKAFFDSEACQAMSEKERVGVIESFLEAGSLATLVQDNLSVKGAVFFEEGLVQKSLMFVGLQGATYEDHLVQNYLDTIPLPSVLVHVQSDPETCRQRMMARPQGLTMRLRTIETGNICHFLEDIQAHLEKLIVSIRKKSEVMVLEVDNSQPLDETVLKQLGDEINSFFLSDNRRL